MPINLTGDLSEKSLQSGREWGDIFRIPNAKNCRSRINCPAKFSFVFENEIKFFHSQEITFLDF